jgi:hypothetical protein
MNNLKIKNKLYFEFIRLPSFFLNSVSLKKRKEIIIILLEYSLVSFELKWLFVLHSDNVNNKLLIIWIDNKHNVFLKNMNVSSITKKMQQYIENN